MLIRPKALVLGGGVAGASAAINLSQRDVDVTLVERDAVLGGERPYRVLQGRRRRVPVLRRVPAGRYDARSRFRREAPYPDPNLRGACTARRRRFLRRNRARQRRGVL
ncbi:MAG TPA: FAD-dependent oxidoreductase [Chloroflexi bacterium]|nr:FAD-dependent oxidoreductase [Chloroflexota bacterium]